MKNQTLAAAAATLALGGLAYATFVPRWQETPAALEQHAFVLEGVGHWTGTMTMHMPGMPEPMVSPCSERVRAFGDYWTIADFQMEFMGMEFTGHNTFGYDVAKEAYVGTWIDNMTPSLAVMEGQINERTGNLEMHYEMYDTMTGSLTPYKQVLQRGEDTYTLTFYDLSADEEAVSMELTMHRKTATEAGAGRGDHEGSDDDKARGGR